MEPIRRSDGSRSSPTPFRLHPSLSAHADLRCAQILNLRVLSTSGTEKEQVQAQKVLKLLERGRHWVLVVLLLSNVIGAPIFTHKHAVSISVAQAQGRSQSTNVCRSSSTRSSEAESGPSSSPPRSSSCALAFLLHSPTSMSLICCVDLRTALARSFRSRSVYATVWPSVRLRLLSFSPSCVRSFPSLPLTSRRSH